MLNHNHSCAHLVPVPLVNLKVRNSLATAHTFLCAFVISNILVPHVTQNSRTPGNSLLFPAGSASSSIVVGGAALHVCDLGEAGGIRLLSVVRTRVDIIVADRGHLQDGGCRCLARLSWWSPLMLWR